MPGWGSPTSSDLVGWLIPILVLVGMFLFYCVIAPALHLPT